VAVAAVLAAAVLGPFLISCAIATGDPFLAIDQHTIYYRAAEGLDLKQRTTAAAYVLQKFRAHPIATTDLAVTGLFVRPFAIKWNGLGVWSAWLGPALMGLSLVGLAAFLFWPKGRLLLLIVGASLLPYAFTWNVAAGGEWRFTMHVYGLFVVAALYAAALVPRLADRTLRLQRRPSMSRSPGSSCGKHSH